MNFANAVVSVSRHSSQVSGERIQPIGDFQCLHGRDGCLNEKYARAKMAVFMLSNCLFKSALIKFTEFSAKL